MYHTNISIADRKKNSLEPISLLCEWKKKDSLQMNLD